MPDRPDDWPVQRTLEGRDRQGQRAATGTQPGHRGLKPFLRRDEFAGVLRVELASAIDLPHQEGVGTHRIVRRGLRVLGCVLELQASRLTLASGGSRRLELREAPRVLRDALPVLLGESGDEPHRLRELTQVGRREEQPRVLAAAKLVQRDQARAQIGEGSVRLFRQGCDLLIEGSQLLRHRTRLLTSALQFRCPDLTFEFEPPQVAQQGSFLARKSSGLVVKRLQPGTGTLCHRVGACSIGLLLPNQNASRQGKDRESGSEKAAKHACAAEYSIAMRILGLDVGRRRVGLAISDPSGTLARPLMTLTVSGQDRVARITATVQTLAGEEDGIGQIVVGLPRHLDGTASEQTADVEQFITALRSRIAIPVATEDERLSSREAESRLALRERDWKKRKAQLDAAAAAVILQDYLDRRTVGGAPQPSHGTDTQS